jgi:hypothetical protein
VPERNSPVLRTTDLLTATPDLKMDGESIFKDLIFSNPTVLADTRNQTPTLRPSSLQQLQAMEMFQTPDESIHDYGETFSVSFVGVGVGKKGSDAESLLLETEQYVRQMKRRRGEVLTRIDSSAGDRLRRRVGYEIERRLVRVSQARKRAGDAGLATLLMSTLSRKRRRRDERGRHRRRHHRHRFCMRCVTSSFGALFEAVVKPLGFHCGRDDDDDVGNDTEAAGDDEVRTPTPKMLLSADGKLQWPVFQFGGHSGTGIIDLFDIILDEVRLAHNVVGLCLPGMLISAQDRQRFAAKPKSDPTTYQRLPGRENFTLGDQGQTVKTGLDVDSNNFATNNNNNNNKEEANDERLVGWLQVRHKENGRAARGHKRYIPVVRPSPFGPFRKAPWHGNVHVLNF